MKRTSFRQPPRRGAAAVEAAVMLPLLILATFTAIDVAQYVNACQVMSNVSREGARIATRRVPLPAVNARRPCWHI